MSSYTFELANKSTFDEIMIERGVEQDNQAHGIAPPVELAAFVRDKADWVIGGVYGEIHYDWLYIDLLWVDTGLQGRGYGRQLLTSIQQAARAYGIERVYLATTSFQALAFYYRMGLKVFGVMQNRPPGYHYYWLHKDITDETHGVDLLPVTNDPTPDDFRIIREGLSAHTRSANVPSDGKRLTVFMRDDANRIAGGLISATYWGWLDIQTIWVEESLRGQGCGRELLRQAEQEALNQGCSHAFADVSSLQSLGFFAAAGYTTFASLPDRPRNHHTYFMQKPLMAYQRRYY